MKSRDQCVAELEGHRFEPCWTCVVGLIDARLALARKKLESVTESDLKRLQGRIDELKKIRADMGGTANETNPEPRDE